MRYNDFKLTEAQVRERVKARYPDLTEEQIDEIIPALGAVGGAIAKGAAAAGRIGAKAAGAGLRAAGRVGAKMGKAVATKVAGAGKTLAKGAIDKAASKVQQKAMGQMANTLLKRGSKLPIPDKSGKPQEFEVDDVKGTEVTLKNPKPKPGEPIKTVHNKKDLDPIIQQMAGMSQ